MEALLPFAEAPQPWVCEHPDGVGVLESLALILRAALPVGVISAEELQAGLQAQMDDVLGPSLSVEAPALDYSAGAYTPVAEASAQAVEAVVVDFSLEAAPRFIPYVADQLPELLISFESSRPEVIPDPAILLQLALDWAQGDGSADRVQYWLKTRARTLLRASDFPPSLWACAMRAAAAQQRSEVLVWPRSLQRLLVLSAWCA